MSLASSGRRTLLVELGERSFFSHMWGQDFGFKATSVEPNLWVSRWQGEDCLKEYLGYLLKVRQIADLFFENRVMKALVNSAPALKELAISGKLSSGPRKVGPEMPYDDIVLDAYATGHFKALMNASVGMSEAIGFGPMGEQSRDISEVLSRSDITEVYIVALPEELPVKESLELSQFLKSQFGLRAKIILNKSFLGLANHKELVDLKSDIASSEASVVNTKYFDYLISKTQDEEDFEVQLKGEADKFFRLEHFYRPASLELYREVSKKLSEVVDAK